MQIKLFINLMSLIRVGKTSQHTSHNLDKSNKETLLKIEEM